MKLTIDVLQNQPSLTICDDDGIIQAKVYACKNGTVVCTKRGNFHLPIGCRTMENQIGGITDVPEIDGFEL